MAEPSPTPGPPAFPKVTQAAAPPGQAKAKPAYVIPESDFDDRLSPMLVKELRQGLRAKTFVVVFLTLQGLLCFMLMITTAGAAASSSVGGESASKMIFFLFAFSALVIQPMRGIGALHSEIRGNTIELMVLTRLTAWRIALGKWTSIVSQTGLLFIAVAPYLILRYFFGGMQLFAELLMLTSIFFVSAVFTAITVGLSAVPSILIRGLIPLFGAFVVGAGVISFVSGENFPAAVKMFSLSSSDDRWIFLGGAMGGIYLGWLLLSLGASMIAPAAENHATMARIVALASVVVIALAGAVKHIDPDWLAFALGMVVGPVVILALSQSESLVPPICQPFLRRGALGKVAGRLLYPGWVSGTIFSLLAVALCAIALKFSRIPLSPEQAISMWSLAGTFLLPAAFLGLLHRKAKNRFGVYGLFLLVTLLLTPFAVAYVFSLSPPKPELLWWFSWLPPLAPKISATFPGHDYLAPLLACVYAVIALIPALLKLGSISEIEDQTLQLEEAQQPL